jgi:hypothetical protein
MIPFLMPANKPWARALAALVAFALAAPLLAGDAKLVYYRSPIDDTDQAYGVYVPTAPAPPSGYPCILHTHGYGWYAGADFSPWQMQWADEHGWVLLNLNARGPLFYEGLGEAATREVVEDAIPRFALDRRRLFMTGASMGGTGAFRQGIRHPDVFAAIAAVDGWTDWREWYAHWYARRDMKYDIDEFRRPLLSSAAPLYWAEQCIWGRIRAIVDGRDDVVLPGQEMLLNQRLSDLQNENPGAYRADLILNREVGHGGGYDLGAIYDFFLHSAPSGLGHRVRIAAWRLLYAQQGWLRIDQIRNFGRLAAAESVVRDGRISVWTDNVSAVEVTPADAPEIARLDACEVWIDGQLIYAGKPALVRAVATSDAAGALLWWRLDDGPDATPAVYEKRPGLEGPVGDAFNQPFFPVYAAHGAPDDIARHRREANTFCAVWNEYFVHAPGISPRPEDDVTNADMVSHNLILFGCEDCSSLLRLAARSHPFPIDVRHTSIAVREASGRDRTFTGANFGCFFIYPNPLAPCRYLVVASGQWKMVADTEELAGLEFDLEKMPFAYPDFVVFNSDRRQLPFVLNFSNKPHTKAYDCAYFVDVGYFDNSWRLLRDFVSDWVKALKPARARLIHVAEMTRAPDALSVRILDTDGGPVEKARVTLGPAGPSVTALTGPDGWARFTGLSGGVAARLLAVMATGCAYDRPADCLAASDCAAAFQGLAGAAYAGPGVVDAGSPCLSFRFRVAALGRDEVRMNAVLAASRGAIVPEAAQLITLTPGREQTVEWQLREGADLAGLLSLRLTLTAHQDGSSLTAEVPATVEVAGEPPAPLDLVDLKASRDADTWQVSVVATNTTCEPLDATLRGLVVQAAWPLPPRPLHLAPASTATVTWSVRAADLRAWTGLARLVVYADGLPPAAARAEIVLPSSGGTDLASAR